MTSSAATDGQTELLEALVADEELISMLEGLLIGDALLPLQKELLKEKLGSSDELISLLEQIELHGQTLDDFFGCDLTIDEAQWRWGRRGYERQASFLLLHAVASARSRW